MSQPTIGFIGQGWIGKNYADNFEARGFAVTRYALEEPYRANKEIIKTCDIVFIAVPTPTTPEGFDSSIVASALEQVGKGKIAVIKSTIIPGTTKRLQEKYPEKIVLYSPEFLSEATAKYDTDNPFANIVGYASDVEAHKKVAEQVLAILPEAQFSLVCTSTEGEIIKYSSNISGYFQIVLFNMIYDLASTFNVNWEHIQQAIEANPLICNRYAKPVHKSGRGAGGNCFLKDFVAFKNLYTETMKDKDGVDVFEAIEQKNLFLLKNSDKDQEIVKNIYGNK